jgi:hydroxypyruvate isomerase
MSLMPKLAANLTMLFTEYPFLERFDRAAASGFRGVEFLFPYEEDPAVLRRDALERNGLDLVLFNLPSGNWAEGDRGLAADPARKEEFERGVDRAVEYAAALRPPRINCLAGKTADVEASRENLVANVRLAADAMRATGTTLLVEPVNTHDVPGFALPTTQSALDLLAAVERDNVGLQYDVYHAIRMDEDPFAFLRENGATVDHIQIADVPGRHQPGTGDVDFEQLFSIIDESGYDGWVSLEYIPDGPTEEGFGLLRSLGVLG